MNLKAEMNLGVLEVVKVQVQGSLKKTASATSAASEAADDMKTALIRLVVVILGILSMFFLLGYMYLMLSQKWTLIYNNL